MTQNVTVTHGVYNVDVGDVTPIHLAFDVQYYLGIKAGMDPEMTPRRVLTSVGYAYRAQTVERRGAILMSDHIRFGFEISIRNCLTFFGRYIKVHAVREILLEKAGFLLDGQIRPFEGGENGSLFPTDSPRG